LAFEYIISLLAINEPFLLLHTLPVENFLGTSRKFYVFGNRRFDTNSVLTLLVQPIFCFYWRQLLCITLP